MVCSINALEQLQCWEREWWTPGINYNLTMQSHNSKSSSLHLQVESKAYFCAGYLSFSLSYSIIVPKGGVPIFYDFCNNALEPLPPIIGLVLYIFYNWLLFVWNVFYAWSQSKNHYTISFWIVGHFQTTPTADCEKMITFKVIWDACDEHQTIQTIWITCFGSPGMILNGQPTRPPTWQQW